MNPQPAPHPNSRSLRAYGLGDLDNALAKAVGTHLKACPECRQRLAAIAPDPQPHSARSAVSATDGLSLLDAGPAPPPPPASSLPPGLADHPDYEILRELGRGGMGTVFLARNILMGRLEVLKVASGHLLNRPEVIERFLGEVRNAARLQHPNIVTAYSAIRMSESLVLAMQYVDGLDLSRLVKARGPLPVANACNYIHQAALGLQHAHERGMVHRDIKPSNLMLSRQGNRAVIKVLDFGLATVTSEAPTDRSLTYEGQMLGTPDFIAPEQIIDARRADIRADIYSLGCTFYYILTGHPPFAGASLYDLLQAHHSLDALPLNLARPEVPVALAALVAKMMAKEPERRFQKPSDVAKALTPFFKNASQAGPEPMAEVSQAGNDQVQAQTLGAVSGLLARAPNTEAAPSAAGQPPPQPARPEPTWESFIEQRGADLRPGSAQSKRKGIWVFRPAIVAAAIFAITAIGVVLYVFTYRGGIRVEAGPTAESSRETKAPAVPKAPRSLSPLSPVNLTFRPGVGGYDGAFGLCYFGLGRRDGPGNPCLWADWPDNDSPDINQRGGVAVLRFDDLIGRGAGRIPAGGTIIRARLRVVTQEGRGGRGHGARIFRLKKFIEFQDVMETLLREAGGDRSEIIAPLSAWAGDPTLQRVIEAGPIELDVTADVQAWASGMGNHGWAFIPWPKGRDGWGFLKPNCAEIANRPSLSVSFIPPAVGDPADDGAGSPTGASSSLERRPAKPAVGSADPTSKPESITNSIGMKLIQIPAGKFRMGITDDETDVENDKKPQHLVRITKPFFLGIHEVTRGQFKRFVDETGYRTDAEKDGKGGWGWGSERQKWEQHPDFTWLHPCHEQTDEDPVVEVDWNDALAFAEWLSLKEGKGYRLPTEAEWEYACRAGRQTRYSFGDNAEALSEYAWYDKNSGGVTHPVGRKRPNPWGLFDMHGNVWEWCSDGYARDYYGRSPVNDPTGASDVPDRVIRGGSRSNNQYAEWSAFRWKYAIAHRTNYLGFRIVSESSGR